MDRNTQSNPSNDDDISDRAEKLISPHRGKQVAKAGVQIAGGGLPFIGGLLSAAAAAWSEHEQKQVNKIFHQWLQMLQDELKEKAQTIVEIIIRLDSKMKRSLRVWSHRNTKV